MQGNALWATSRSVVWDKFIQSDLRMILPQHLISGLTAELTGRADFYIIPFAVLKLRSTRQNVCHDISQRNGTKPP